MPLEEFRDAAIGFDVAEQRLASVILKPAMGSHAKAQRREEEADANQQAFSHRVSENECASLCVFAPLRDIRSSHRRI